MRGSVGSKLLLVFLGTQLVAPAIAADPPASIRVFRSDTVVEPDGRTVQTSRIEIAVSNDAAARSEAQQAMTYADDIERVELVEGYTLKLDGRRLPVLPSAVRVQLAPGTPNVPQYGNRKQIVAILPDVAGGDVTSVTWRRTVRWPTFPGQFALTTIFTRAFPWDEAEVSVSLPPGMTLLTEEHGPDHMEADEDGRHVHRWHWTAPARASDPAVLAPLDRAPRIFASTFPDWAAFSRTYAALRANDDETSSPRKFSLEGAEG